MTFEEIYAQAIDPAMCRAHSACLAERAMMVAADEPEPMTALMRMGREAVAGQLRAICSLVAMEDQATVQWWEWQFASAFADRAITIAAHWPETPRGVH